MYHICYSNPRAWEISYLNGVYGNVETGNNNTNTLWGKLRDLIAIVPGDKVFFYIKEEMVLRGIFEAVSQPYICTDDLFDDPLERYPLRFNFREIANFPNAVPVSELAKLIENGTLSTISSFERDTQGNFRGIKQITDEEANNIQKLFFQYNPKTNLDDVIITESPEVEEEEEAANIVDWILNNDDFDEPWRININELPLNRIRGRNISRYEYALQAYIYYCLRNRLRNVIEDLTLNNFNECLLEVPLLKAQQFRSDILCIYKGIEGKPHFYSIVEIKNSREITIQDLSQLIGYMRTFAETKGIPFKSIEGVCISTSFEEDAIQYLINRRTVERENPIRLIRDELDNNGHVSFTQLN
jgi:hypothetical protein